MPKSKKNTAADFEIGVIYARYSSHNQKEASIEQQIEACLKHAKDLNIKIIESYEDRAISGRTDKRPSFQRMMKDAERRKFDYVIAWKSNRIGRNMLDAMMNEAKLNSFGIRVLYVEEDFDDTAAGRFALRSMMNVNQFYSENMAEDIKRGMDDNAKNCMVNGTVAYGFKKGPDGKYAIDEPRAEIVREIFKRVSKLEPFVDIFNDLNSRGLRSATGKEWNRSSFHRMLVNERYRGVYIWGNSKVEGGIPRIISDELFYKVQEVLKTKNNAHGRHREYGDYLLTGKLFCGMCESPMTGISGTSKSKSKHYYYICQKKRNEHSCEKETVRRDEIELAVAQSIKDYALKPDVIEKIADWTVSYAKKQEENPQLIQIQERIKEIQRSIKNIMSAIEQGIFTESTRDRLLTLESEQKALTEKLASERADVITISKEEIIEILESFCKGDVHDKKFQARLFNTFLKAVYLYDDELKIVFSFTGGKTASNFPFKTNLDLLNTEENQASSCVRLISPKLHHWRVRRTPSPFIWLIDTSS